MSEEDYSVMMNGRRLRQVLSDALRLLGNDIKSAKWAMMCIIAYFVLVRRLLHSMCPLVFLTGFPCPGCGLTRAGFQVIQMDFAGAWNTHPFIFPLIALAVLFCIERYFLMKKKMPALKALLIVTLIGMILFYIWRMWNYFPGEPPVSYYDRNLIRRLIHLLQMNR